MVKTRRKPVPQVATATSAQPLALRVYVGPKDYDDLKKMNPPLHGLINFGWLEFIAGAALSRAESGCTTTSPTGDGPSLSSH